MYCVMGTAGLSESRADLFTAQTHIFGIIGTSFCGRILCLSGASIFEGHSLGMKQPLQVTRCVECSDLKNSWYSHCLSESSRVSTNQNF